MEGGFNAASVRAVGVSVLRRMNITSIRRSEYPDKQILVILVNKCLLIESSGVLGDGDDPAEGTPGSVLFTRHLALILATAERFI